MKRRILLVVFLIAGVVLSGGCGDSSDDVSGAESVILAEDALGPITADDVDRYLLEQDPGERWKVEGDRSRWYETVIHRIALDRYLEHAARERGLDAEPGFKTRERAILRNAAADEFLRSRGVPRAPSEEEIRQYYDEHPDEFSRDEQRNVLHIYKRVGANVDQDDAISALGALRRAILDGASFEEVAREHSDSESRHRGGRLGYVSPGQHTEDFDRVVFGLAQGTLSDPVRTADGGHLFFVEGIIEARQFSFEEARLAIARKLATQLMRQALVEAADACPRPKPDFVPDARDLGMIARGGDPEAAVLRVGDFELSIAELNEAVIAARRHLGPRVDPLLPMRIIDEIRLREIIYQHVRESGGASIGSHRVDKERRRQLVDYALQQTMEDTVAGSADTIRSHYENNTMRFASPITVHVVRLAVPLGANPAGTMAVLEAARNEVSEGRMTLESLADRLSGTVADLGMVSPSELQAVDLRALRFAFVLRKGECSPPYRSGNTLAMFMVLDRLEPEIQPLALARERVIDDYLTTFGPRILAEMAEQTRLESGFVLHRDRLERFGATGVAR